MSRWLFKFERRVVWEHRRRWAIALLAAYVGLALLDGALFHRLYVGAGVEPAGVDDARRSFEAHDWAAMLRGAGYLPVWLALGAAIVIAGQWRDGLRIACAAALGGALAEVLKPVVGRVRPLFTDGVHVYRHSGILDGKSISFGMASSHAGVAFAAACMVLFIYGRPGWVALLLAVGCGVERMMAGAHFATDVYVGALLGYASARLLRPGGWSGVARGAGGREGLLLP